MINKINILDSIMGSGKTTAIIDMINENKDKKYIYITPFLSEVDRVKKNCKNHKFFDPKNFGKGKLDSFHRLLLQGKDISSTHALFRFSNEITKQLISNNDYTLILDEVMDVVEEKKFKKDDIPSMLDLNLISIDEKTKEIKWNEEKKDYDGEYNYVKDMCVNNQLFYINDKCYIWTFPAEIFKSFKEVYILTYLFDSQIQKYYYDLYNLKYDYYYVKKINEKFTIVPKDERYKEYEKYIKNDLKKKIHVLDDTINNIGTDEYSLSVTWFRKNKDNELIEQLKKNIYNFFYNKVNSKSKYSMWTTYKDYKKYLTGKGYTKGFVSCNCRATNDYVEKYNLTYCCNRYLKPVIKNFFIDRNIEIDEDTYALSEMLQWIWRSRIRRNEEINIYIPSKRMRNLLINWLNN